jgi:hypothetical protein
VSQSDIEKPSNDSASDSVQQISITSVDLPRKPPERRRAKKCPNEPGHPHLQTDLIVDSEGGKILDSRSFSPDTSAHCLPFLVSVRHTSRKKLFAKRDNEKKAPFAWSDWSAHRSSESLKSSSGFIHQRPRYHLSKSFSKIRS